eukprot:gnl/Chilomastix_cuspidata/4525.p1 GENE.gnl/Chilomastix_cuspidata/4525~~gnl/Chilomastix_cuspidata/4525.p1  ORF type:complete len:1009 (+),score=326.73 gnl/Chilomastix_cuspidata/4525:178-3027(+)
MSRFDSRSFQFDNVFGPSTKQVEVFDMAARDIVEDVMRGYNGTLLAYGQTGTGKTYSMGLLGQVGVGDSRPSSARGATSSGAPIIPANRSSGFVTLDSQRGIVSRSLRHMFSRLHLLPGAWSVSLSFLQIYQEAVSDLLAPSRAARASSRALFRSGALDSPSNRPVGLQIRQSSEQGFFVEGLSKHSVASPEQAAELINRGLSSRKTGPTYMNPTSSRSHTVLILRVKQGAAVRGGAGPALESSLIIVDLAGSERVKRSHSDGIRLTEAKAINQSLSALGNVISALSYNSKHSRPGAADAADAKTSPDGESTSSNPASRPGSSHGLRHVPFRDSPLTKILSESLSGNARASLIATISPETGSAGESLSTLLFAGRCKNITTTPYLNVQKGDGGGVSPGEFADYLCNGVQFDLAIEAKQNGKSLEAVLRALDISDSTFRNILLDRMADVIRAERKQHAAREDGTAPRAEAPTLAGASPCAAAFGGDGNSPSLLREGSLPSVEPAPSVVDAFYELEEAASAVVETAIETFGASKGAPKKPRDAAGSPASQAHRRRPLTLNIQSSPFLAKKSRAQRKPPPVESSISLLYSSQQPRHRAGAHGSVWTEQAFAGTGGSITRSQLLENIGAPQFRQQGASVAALYGGVLSLYYSLASVLGADVLRRERAAEQRRGLVAVLFERDSLVQKLRDPSADLSAQFGVQAPELRLERKLEEVSERLENGVRELSASNLPSVSFSRSIPTFHDFSSEKSFLSYTSAFFSQLQSYIQFIASIVSVKDAKLDWLLAELTALELGRERDMKSWGQLSNAMLKEIARMRAQLAAAGPGRAEATCSMPTLAHNPSPPAQPRAHAEPHVAPPVYPPRPPSVPNPRARSKLYEHVTFPERNVFVESDVIPAPPRPLSREPSPPREARRSAPICLDDESESEGSSSSDSLLEDGLTQLDMFLLSESQRR